MIFNYWRFLLKENQIGSVVVNEIFYNNKHRKTSFIFWISKFFFTIRNSLQNINLPWTYKKLCCKGESYRFRWFLGFRQTHTDKHVIIFNKNGMMFNFFISHPYDLYFPDIQCKKTVLSASCGGSITSACQRSMRPAVVICRCCADAAVWALFPWRRWIRWNYFLMFSKALFDVHLWF